MKKLILIVAVLVTGLKVKAQNYTDDTKTMTDSAIFIMYRQAQDYIKKKASAPDYLDNIYIFNEYNEPLKYLSAPYKLKLKLLDLAENKNHKIASKGVDAWKVITSLKSNTFTITILEVHLTYKNRNYDLGNGGGLKVVFEYSCNENKWLLLSAKSSGI